jgi:hypothetical protein
MVKFSDLDPIQRVCSFLRMTAEAEASERSSLFERLTPLRQEVAVLSDVPVEGPLNTALVSILATMYAVDQVFERDCLFSRHVYLLGDDAILRANPEAAVCAGSLSPNLELLSNLGLIYRFNVAPKFGVEQRTTMQLRLNGWGRHLVERFGEISKPPHLARVDDVRNLVRSAHHSYMELLTLCDAQSRPLAAARIGEINSTLPFRVVT